MWYTKSSNTSGFTMLVLLAAAAFKYHTLYKGLSLGLFCLQPLVERRTEREKETYVPATLLPLKGSTCYCPPILLSSYLLAS